MKTSEQTNELVTALAKAQGSLANPTKDARNPHFNSRYADLSGGLNAIREALSVNGLSVIQAPRIDGDVLMLDTRLSHASGQWIECEYPVCKLGVPQQQIGSAMTYARRYSLFAVVGIAGEDDDGNDASKSETPAPSTAFLAPEQVDEIQAMLDQLDPETERAFLKFMRVGFVSAIPAKDFTYAKGSLAKKIAAKAKAPEAVQ